MLRDMIDVNVVVYMDDILIYTKEGEDHEAVVRAVFKRFLEHGVKLAAHKCSFAQAEVPFLGWLITGGSIKVDPNRISKINDWDLPRNATELRSFVGLANQLLPAVKKLGWTLGPLTDLLKGVTKKTAPITWTPEAEAAFHKAKDMCNNPAHLRPFDNTLETYLYTDWSKNGIGAWIGQKQPTDTKTAPPLPVAFYSAKLTPAEKRYAPYHGELFALHEAVKHFRQYLVGRPVHLRFDQRALETILTQRKLNACQQRWISEIMEFDLRPKWIKGTDNSLADFLSRLTQDRHESTQTDSLSLSLIHAYGDTQLAIPDSEVALSQTDPFYDELKNGLRSKEIPVEYVTSAHHFIEKDDLLWYDNRLCISPERAKHLAHEYHHSASRLHPGQQKTLAGLYPYYYCPDLRHIVKNVVTSCDNCQRTKLPTNPIPTPTFSHDAPPQKGHTISIDFFTGLPEIDGLDSIMTVVDHLTRRTNFIPAAKTDTAADVAKRFVRSHYRLYGLPTRIISDRDKIWTSHFWTAVCQHLKIERNLSTAFHPQTDGLPENRHRSLSTWFRMLPELDKGKWLDCLPLAEYALNNTPNVAIGMSPLEADMGHQPRTFEETATHATPTPTADLFVQHQKELTTQLRSSLEEFQEGNTRPLKKFQKNDYVLVKLRDFYPDSKDFKNNLRNPWTGPFKIAAPFGLLSCKLTLPRSWQIHPVFHTSRLKAYVGTPPKITPPAPKLVQGKPEYYISEIIADRIRKNTSTPEYLVLWEGYPLEDATWQSAASVKNTAALKNYLLEQQSVT